MNELLKKIYNNVIIFEPGTIEANKRLDKKVEELLEPYQSQFDEKDREIIKNLMYSILFYAKQEGFQIGTQYTLKLLFSLLMDS